MKMTCRFSWVFMTFLLCAGCDSAQVDLEKEIAEASDLEAWVLASMPIQPLVVGIIRSMEPGSKIVHFQLERDAETPSQLRIRLVLNTASEKQLEQTLEAIRQMNFRESNQTYTRSDGNLVYTARLLRNYPQSQTRQTPEQRQSSSVTMPSIFRSEAEGVDAGVEKAGTEKEELQIQPGMEQELLKFVSYWKPHLASVEEQQATEAAISMKVREADVLTLSQRYEQVPHKIADKDVASLPTLTRATLLFVDDYAKLINWLGTVEQSIPTMRVGKLDLTSGARQGDVRMELTLEVPLHRRGS